MQRYSQLLGISTKLEQMYDEVVISTKVRRFRKHGKRDRKKDVKLIVDMMSPQLYTKSAGRSFFGFENFLFSTTISKPKSFKERILKHKELLATKRNIAQNK